MLDNTMLVKVLAAGAGLACTMALAFAHMIDGPTAMHSVEVITGVFLGGAAVLGGAQAMAKRTAVPSTIVTNTTMPPAVGPAPAGK